jgi:uncharacterized repeat protein (TIGR03803 family)
MPARGLFTRLRSLSFIIIAVLFVTSAWGSDHKTVLYSFGGPPDGIGPTGDLLRDSSGTLYGTTYAGGEYCIREMYNCGTVFQLSRAQGGGWTETVLHSFGSGSDGIDPNGSLIMDAAGNLYGTSGSGENFGAGNVFELSPDGHGGWTETILHTFDRTDGDTPTGGLIMDAAGNLYGTTSYGGAYGWGAVFELSPSAGGWTETVLHSFNYNSSEGHSPIGGLVMDAAGNLYGTTYNGGAGGGFCQGAGCGTVYELSPGAGGWTETVLHSFIASDGYGPEAGLVMDAAGNLYGTTYQGGNLEGDVCAPFGCGTVFEVSPVSGGGWTETTLYSFNGQPDAGYPMADLLLDARGNLYSTTSFGGTHNYGTAFELSPRQGSWRETVLYSFDGSTDGTPAGGLTLNPAADLYGASSGGQAGMVYELTAPSICGVQCLTAVHIRR